jgi:signal transduction histidine kinase
MTRLLVIKGNDRGKQFELLADDLTSIGRDARNAIQLGDPEVSRTHAIIKRTGDGFIITDQNSSNGTFVNERRVQQHALESRDLIRTGQTTMIFDSSPVVSMVDIQSMVSMADSSLGNEDASSSRSRIVQTISAKVAQPVFDDDSQITDSFLEHLEENIHVIYHTAVATSRITDIDELHQKVLQLIFDWVKADRGCVLLLDEDTRKITPVAFRQSEALENTGPMEINRSILQYAAERNEGVLTSDVESDSRWKKTAGSDTRKGGFVEAMCAPMHGRMGTVGFIYVDHIARPQPKRKKATAVEPHFSTSQLKLLLAVAHQAALATENATYYASMTQNAQLAAVGQTFTQIAHHLRNMLQGLNDAKHRVSEGIEKQDWSRVADGWREIDPLTSRIYELSLNLLSFSRPREPQLIRESLNDTVADVVATVEKTAQARGIRLDWEPDLNFRPAFFDPEAIYRALLNVVHNAIDACDLGGVVKIRIVENKDRAEISVIDDGEGIDPRKINLIFKPFATSKGESGTGIGLPVARKIMREHGGDVAVSSSAGHGSRFTLWMPLRRSPGDAVRRGIDTSMHKKPE